MNDQIEVLLVFLIHLGLVAKEAGKGQHSRQRVVDLVGHSGRKATDRGQLLGPADVQPSGLLQLLLASDNRFRHAIDRITENPQFARRTNTHSGSKVTADQASDHRRDLPHRPEHERCDKIGQQQARNRRHDGRRHHHRAEDLLAWRKKLVHASHQHQGQDHIGHQHRGEAPRGEFQENGHRPVRHSGVSVKGWYDFNGLRWDVGEQQSHA